MLSPSHEAKSLPGQTRGRISEHQGGLDQQRAGAAHRIQQGGRFLLIRPGAEGDQTGGKGLLERGHAAAQAIAPAMQTFTRKVEGNGCGCSVDMQVYSHPWMIGIDRGSLPETFPEDIDQGILQSQSGEPVVPETGTGFPGERTVNGKGRADTEMLMPGYIPAAAIEHLLVGHLEPRQLKENPRGKPRPETGPVAACEIAAPADDAS